VIEHVQSDKDRIKSCLRRSALANCSQSKGFMNILIVEDNRAIRQLIRRFVGAARNTFFECEDGSQALDAYRLHQPDWVLMDVMMPGTDGITATRALCQAFPQAKIIIITNYDDDDLRQAAAEAGASGYVLKENLFEVLTLMQTDKSH
jgi:CheY-like chemotaxis protein